MTIITECLLHGKYALGMLKSYLPSYLIITKQFFWDVTIPNFLDGKTEDLVMGNIRLPRFPGLSLPILGSCVLRLISGYRICISHLFFFLWGNTMTKAIMEEFVFPCSSRASEPTAAGEGWQQVIGACIWEGASSTTPKTLSELKC